MGKPWPIELTFFNVNNFIACVAGVERGRGQGGREKGGGNGRRLITSCISWLKESQRWSGTPFESHL